MHQALYDALTPARGKIYRGTVYRSRAEAKWAFVLNELGVPFYYEPELTSLPSGYYLPDFYLPTLDTYLEVKPCDVPDPRHGELGLDRVARVFVVAGNLPQVPFIWSNETELLDALRGHIWLKWPEQSLDYMLGREHQGRINLVPIAQGSTCRGDDPAILGAYIKASTYKFTESEPIE